MRKFRDLDPTVRMLLLYYAAMILLVTGPKFVRYSSKNMRIHWNGKVPNESLGSRYLDYRNHACRDGVQKFPGQSDCSDPGTTVSEQSA